MRFYISTDNGVTKDEICCDSGGIKLIWEKDSTNFFFRKKLKGTITIYDCVTFSAYTTILALTDCDLVNFYVYEDDGTTSIFEGYFYKRNCSFNEDLCEVEIEVSVLDDYTMFIKNADKEYNILSPSVQPANTELELLLQRQNVYKYADVNVVTAVVISNDTLWNGASLDGNGNWVGFETGDEGSPYFIGDCTPPDASWQLYSIEWVYLSPNNFLTTVTYAKDSIYMVRLGNVRADAPAGYTYYTTTILYNITIDIYTKDTLSVDTYAYEYNGAVSTRLNAVIITSSTLIRTARSLSECIDYILYDVFGSKWFESIFFRHGVVGAASTEATVGSANLKHLMVIQNTDLKCGDCTDKATVLNLSFNKIMGALNTMFNVYYYIDTTGVLHIEHLKYFMNGLSYSSAKSVGIDLTVCAPDSLIYTNRYSYDGEYPIREVFKYSLGDDPDIIGLPIEYTDCIKEGSEVSRNVEASVQINDAFVQDILPDEGFTILHCIPNADYEGYYDIVKFAGVITGGLKSNAYLGFPRLQEVYWKDWGRPFASGIMNGADAVFTNIAKTKIQKGIEFSTADITTQQYIIGEFFGYTSLGVNVIQRWYGDFGCEVGDTIIGANIPNSVITNVYISEITILNNATANGTCFFSWGRYITVASFDPMKLITTNLGNGEVEEAEYTFKTNSYKVKLKY